MAVSFLMRLMWTACLIALQVLVFNHIQLFGYATPLVYVYVLCLQPLDTPRHVWLLWAFLTGVVVDMFAFIPGVGAGSMTLAAFFAPKLLQLFTPKDSVEDMMPGYVTLGGWKFFWYVTAVVFLHHAVFFMLEAFSFYNLKDLLFAWSGSSLLTIASVLALAALRNRKQGYNNKV